MKYISPMKGVPSMQTQREPQPNPKTMPFARPIFHGQNEYINDQEKPDQVYAKCSSARKDLLTNHLASQSQHAIGVINCPSIPEHSSRCKLQMD